MTKFTQLNLSAPTMAAINKFGFEETTPIQAQTIPVAIAGRDLIGQAPTGTGKTIAFGIPIVENINSGHAPAQAIVITPTRELAIQVCEELNKVANFKEIHALPIYGGQDISRQIRALKKRPEIIVGTPGRLMDHMRRKTIRLDNIKMVVLDEADEMLNMGFVEDIETILKEIPSERQTLLFSATMPRRIQQLAEQFMKNPEVIRVAPKEVTVANTDQYYIEILENKKFDVLCNLLDTNAPTSAIVFGRTKRRVDEVAEALNKRGYSAEPIHGDLNQAKRDSVMNQFRQNMIEILVATDVAARGLDIGSVTHVYNYDIPQDPESYVHRVGRTGRAGKQGAAITLVTPREMPQLRLIEQLIRRKIVRQEPPTLVEALHGAQHTTVERLLAAVDDPTIASYRTMAESMLAESDSVNLLAAAIKLLTKEPNTTPVRISEERPISLKKANNNRGKRENRPYYGNAGKANKGKKRGSQGKYYNKKRGK